MAVIPSVPPSATYVKFITSSAKAQATTLEIIMDAYIEFSVKEGKRRCGGEPGPRTFIGAL